MCSVTAARALMRLPERNESFFLRPAGLPMLAGATAVHLAFEHEGWEPKHPLRRDPEGAWHATVSLPQGARRYAVCITTQDAGVTTHLDPDAPEADVTIDGHAYKASLRLVSGF